MRRIDNLKLLKFSNGFTLVELLIGLVLSLFIAGVALTYFVSSSKTFRAQTSESVIQENARFALELLSQNFRLAGMNPSNDFSTKLDVIYNGNRCGADEAGVNDNASGTSACTREGQTVTGSTVPNSDRVAIDYVLDATNSTSNINASGCNGSFIQVNAGTKVHLASTFWTADIDNDGVRSLYCQTINLDTGLAEGSAAPLIDGVDRMQVQYGVDDNENGIIERYQSYSNLGATKIDKVRAIRLALLINSGLGFQSDTVTEKEVERKFTLLDAPEEKFEDYQLRNIYTTTVALPNTLL